MPAFAPLYLDYASTTHLAVEVMEAMQTAEKQGFANPASQHQAGRTARRVLENAREEILTLLHANTNGMHADRLIFTSGGTEANHLALLGIANQPGERVLISAVEHSSIQGAANILRQRGVIVDSVPVDCNGDIDITQFEVLLTVLPKPKLVSIMTVNNETGVAQNIPKLAQLCHAHDILIHTDAVQAIGILPISFQRLSVDAMTIAPHKFHGPVGIGGLFLRHSVQLEPQIRGGFQQAGLRAGTESVVLAVGFASALRFNQRDLKERQSHVTALRLVFEALLFESVEKIVVNANAAIRAGHISNVAFLGVDRQALFLALDMAGVYCSTGSACASGSSESSPVLLAMGLEQAIVESSLRFSFGPATTQSDVEMAVGRISNCVNKLRRK